MDAWKQAFGNLDAERELRKYLSRFAVRAFLYKFTDKVAATKAEASTPSAPDCDAVLARLLRYGNDDQILPRLRRAAAATPPSMLARALLGYTLVDEDKDDEGTRLLVEAASDKDWLVQYYVASGLARRAGGSGKLDPPLMAVATAAIERVLAARPQLAHALSLKARLVRGADGVAAISQARRLAPGREDYLFLEAQLRADLRDFPGARTALAPLLGPNYPPHIRESARSLMGQIVRMEEFYAKRPAGAAPPRSSTDPPSDVPAGGTVQWVFRDVRPGEERVEGRLERIECARSGAITLFVRVANNVQRFAAPAFSDVDFIVYSEQGGGSIGCGDRTPPDPVYVTWRPLEKPPAGIAGRPVAVEFLPPKGGSHN
jgi:hypothetical protein